MTDSSSPESIDDGSIRMIADGGVTTIALDGLAPPFQKLRFVPPSTLITVDQVDVFQLTIP